MDIASLEGIQFYDLIAYFAGDLSSSTFTARYKQDASSEEDNLVRGSLSVSYDATTDETIVSARTAQLPISEGGYIRYRTDYNESIELNLLP